MALEASIADPPPTDKTISIDFPSVALIPATMTSIGGSGTISVKITRSLLVSKNSRIRSNCPDSFKNGSATTNIDWL